MRTEPIEKRPYKLYFRCTETDFAFLKGIADKAEVSISEMCCREFKRGSELALNRDEFKHLEQKQELKLSKKVTLYCTREIYCLAKNIAAYENRKVSFILFIEIMKSLHSEKILANRDRKI